MRPGDPNHRRGRAELSGQWNVGRKRLIATACVGDGKEMEICVVSNDFSAYNVIIGTIQYNNIVIYYIMNNLPHFQVDWSMQSRDIAIGSHGIDDNKITIFYVLLLFVNNDRS